MKYLVQALLVLLSVSCSNIEKELSEYWSGHDFTSLDSFDNIDQAEDQFEGYVRLLDEVPYDLAEASMKEFLDYAAVNPVAYGIWAEWFKSCFHALDSPYRNDRLFSVFLEKVTADGVLDHYMLEPLVLMKNVLENALVGVSAPDPVLRNVAGDEFRFSDFEGHRILVQLLDADCSSCIEYIDSADSEYRGRDIIKIALFVHGTSAGIELIRGQLPSGWHCVWCPGREVEKGYVFDLSLLPSKLIIGKDGLIEKTYHL